MLVTNTIKVINAIYDSVLGFSVEYVEQYNLFCCRIRYDNKHGSVAFVRPSVGRYIINRLQVIDASRNNWRTTDRLLWTTINHLNWINWQEVKQWEALLRYWLQLQLHIAFCNLDFRKLIGGLNMTYRNNYTNENHNIRWNIAVYVKKHFSLVLGNILLNTFC